MSRTEYGVELQSDVMVPMRGSNYPHFDLNPNTGAPLGREQHIVSADNTVYHSRDLPSHIVLPIVVGRA